MTFGLTAQLEHCETWCLSGGADGADLLWGKAAKFCGHGVVHFSFEGHRTVAAADELVCLNQQLLEHADEFCIRANKTLHRHYPPRSRHIRNLLRRNWYQVESATSCYAISSLNADGTIAGGTAWAVEMFLMKYDYAVCDAYVFDQNVCHWFQWDGTAWKSIYQPPKPMGIYAAIGRRARELNVVGRLAIRVLMEYDTDSRHRMLTDSF